MTDVSWFGLVLGRLMDELVLVDVLRQVDGVGKDVPRAEIVAHLLASRTGAEDTGTREKTRYLPLSLR